MDDSDGVDWWDESRHCRGVDLSIPLLLAFTSEVSLQICSVHQTVSHVGFNEGGCQWVIWMLNVDDA